MVYCGAVSKSINSASVSNTWMVGNVKELSNTANGLATTPNPNVGSTNICYAAVSPARTKVSAA